MDFDQYKKNKISEVKDHNREIDDILSFLAKLKNGEGILRSEEYRYFAADMTMYDKILRSDDNEIEDKLIEILEKAGMENLILSHYPEKYIRFDRDISLKKFVEMIESNEKFQRTIQKRDIPSDEELRKKYEEEKKINAGRNYMAQAFPEFF